MNERRIVNTFCMLVKGWTAWLSITKQSHQTEFCVALGAVGDNTSLVHDDLLPDETKVLLRWFTGGDYCSSLLDRYGQEDATVEVAFQFNEEKEERVIETTITLSRDAGGLVGVEGANQGGRRIPGGK